ncbi:TIGR04086 family membrane protein [Falsibacillus albus]|uniref:TIGR04086 family membrane protein n=1 Tax=Falsibacillus albus TaxID=2478915 RepID=A0A3L7K715_9BACI|nr:TIGR04086 family membrane protein [Falsibacillus albus]
MEAKKLGSSVLYGLAAILILAMVSSLIFSLILRFTSLQESSISVLVTVVSFISLFAGGFITGGKGKQKGLMLGGLTGLIYSLCIFLFQYLGYDTLFSMKQMIYHGCFIITAMMGGVLGVNISSARE